MRTASVQHPASQAKLLTPRQRAWIEGTARKAYRLVKAGGATDESYDEWRVREAVSVCGKRISGAPRGAFDDLLSHFEALAGDVGSAYDRQTGKENSWRHWDNEIRKQLHRSNGALGLAYAEGICARQNHGLSMNLVGPEKLKAVFIALRKEVDRRLGERSPSNAEP